jgi:murein DD-endopeptidase MepM/ murein hydrolase activator NlpD
MLIQSRRTHGWPLSNKKPISTNLQDPGSKRSVSLKYRVTDTVRRSLAFPRSLFFLLLVAVPYMANASLFSVAFHSALGTGKNASARTLTSQTIALLEAPAGTEQTTTGTGGPDATIVDGEALAATQSLDDTEGSHLTEADMISIYVVRKGDALSEIADMFGVSANTIRWANNIPSGTSVSEGTVLTILPVSGVRHTVKKGDTIQSIAKKYEGDEAEILSYNDILPSEGLAVGATIIVPGGEVHTPAPAKKAAVRSKIASAVGARTSSPASSPSYAGYYQRPVAGCTRTQGIHGNNGIDIACPVGTPIMAAASGEVIVAKSGDWNGGYGTYIVIAHPNGSQTLYGHLSGLSVSVGQQVSQGETIGAMEIRGGPVNPF